MKTLSLFVTPLSLIGIVLVVWNTRTFPFRLTIVIFSIFTAVAWFAKFRTESRFPKGLSIAALVSWLGIAVINALK